MIERIAVTDPGDVNFNVDLSAGVVHVRARPPFGLETARVTVPVPVLDFLDIAASITLESNKMTRAAIAQLTNGATNGRTA